VHFIGIIIIIIGVVTAESRNETYSTKINYSLKI